MVCRPSIERRRVDLPEPEGPMSAIISPRLTSSETASKRPARPEGLGGGADRENRSDVMVGAESLTWFRALGNAFVGLGHGRNGFVTHGGSNSRPPRRRGMQTARKA